MMKYSPVGSRNFSALAVLAALSVGACKRRAELPDAERVRADLIGQTIGDGTSCSWKFNLPTEIADLTISTTTETRDLLTLGVELRMLGAMDGRLAHGHVDVVYRRDERAWRFANASGPCTIDYAGRGADAGVVLAAAPDAGTPARAGMPTQPIQNMIHAIQGVASSDQLDSAVIPVGASPVRGPNTARTTVVLFSDFQCPFCARLEPTLASLRAKYGADLRVVWKNNPLPFHVQAFPAAEAAMAAGAQGKFWEMHDLIFANQHAMQRADLIAHATTLGLNVARFTHEIDTHVYKPAIDDDIALAARLGARGTPAAFVNGTLVSGAQPITGFESVMTAQSASIAAVSLRGEVYRTLVAANFKSPSSPVAPSVSPYRPPTTAPQYATVSDVGPVRGAGRPLVTIVMLSDFQCPFCSRVEATLGALLTHNRDLKIVWKNNPLPFHRDAELAAEAAMEAYAQQGSAGFWAFHATLFANQRSLARADLEGYARLQGLNMTRFNDALNTHKHASVVKADAAMATAAGLSGTPSFVINGRVLVGAQPETAFQAVVDAERVRARAALGGGVPQAALYSTLVSHPPATPSGR